MSGPPADPGMRFQATRLQDLDGLADFLELACAGFDVDVDADARADLRLATEEVFVNIFRHGYRGGLGPVEVRVARAPDRIEVVITDEAPRFDPASVPPPDLQAGWAERPPGGLGWHLVRQVMDEVGWTPGGERGNAYRLVRQLGRRAIRFQTPAQRETRT